MQMKKFLMLAFTFIALTCCIFLFLLSLADGSTDPFYLRFTSPKQSNLILGTSRSAQGLQPSLFSEQLGQSFYNYSFTIAHSPYGPAYYNSILKKLDPAVKNGIFILTVDPWSISTKNEFPNDSSSFAENSLCVGNTVMVNSSPNFEYLLKNLKGKYYTAITGDIGSGMFLHDDGWLEVSIPMDSIAMKNRRTKKIEEYKNENLPHFHFSSVRTQYLEKTIHYLKAHGSVYIVRLPIDPEILKIEHNLMPDFEQKIAAVIALSDGYLDLTKDTKNYTFTDGNHLYKSSGREVSEFIATWIKTLRVHS